MPKQRKSNGGGWSTGPAMVSPGYLVNQQYDGAGKDCAGTPVRPGYMDMYSSKGLPGLSGGRRRSTRGGTRMQVANFADYAGAVQPVPTELPQTSTHGVPPQAIQQPAQTGGKRKTRRYKGGRYEVSPAFLDPTSAIGASSYAPINSIACEAGTTNALNPSMDLQRATTAIRGGRRRSRGGAQTMSPAPVSFGGSSNFPVVNVGSSGAMAYNAPTAGYRNDFEAFPSGGAVPGLTMQIPYDAKGSNPACTTTGGSRRKRAQSGGNLFHSSPAPISENPIMNRSDFDGTTGGLPVKYGGKRRSRRTVKKAKRGKYCITGKIRKFFGL